MSNKIKVTFLGTAAQIPTMKRNHTAILITYGKENLLVDCGEGSQRQFRKAKINPGKITRILLTHKHGDHTFGLPGLLSTLDFSGYNKTLSIYGPKGMKKFLKDFLDFENVKRKFKIIVSEVSGKFFETDNFYLEAEKMIHGIPINAYNFVIKDKLRINKKKLAKSKIPSGPLLSKIKQGKNINYNGKKYTSKSLTYTEKGKKVSIVLDTLMNLKIPKFVKDADLFVCESSFSSKNFKEAKEHLHLTSEQAGNIAKKAKVGELVLTHISQRYERNLEDLLKEAKKSFKHVSMAKDFDVVEIK